MKFRITYVGPTSQQNICVEKEFKDTETISVKKWAEDWAYMAADKGPFEIEELNESS